MPCHPHPCRLAWNDHLLCCNLGVLAHQVKQRHAIAIELRLADTGNAAQLECYRRGDLLTLRNVDFHDLSKVDFAF